MGVLQLGLVCWLVLVLVLGPAGADASQRRRHRAGRAARPLSVAEPQQTAASILYDVEMEHFLRYPPKPLPDKACVCRMDINRQLARTTCPSPFDTPAGTRMVRACACGNQQLGVMLLCPAVLRLTRRLGYRCHRRSSLQLRATSWTSQPASVHCCTASTGLVGRRQRPMWTASGCAAGMRAALCCKEARLNMCACICSLHLGGRCAGVQ